jgi:hypothetical protein
LSWILPIILLDVNSPRATAAEWQTPEFALPQPLRHPVIACTTDELQRLQAAYRSTGADHDVVARVVAEADEALTRPLEFPPRGGQHNQWYQCDKCQLGLRTQDDTHHVCRRCGQVYTGEPYDDVIFSRRHSANLRNMLSAAWAYRITGEEKYAQLAAGVLLGYAQRYQSYPFHDASRRSPAGRSGGHLFEQTLNEANCMADEIAPAFDLIHDARCLSPADRELIRTGLLVPMLANIDRNKAGKGNWQTWHNAGLLAGGAVLGDASWIQKALSDPQNGFTSQMRESVSAEGMWYENSWGYHFYALSALVHIVEYSRRLGIDLWSHPTLKKMFSLPVAYAMPDGTLPRFGDDVGTRVNAVSRYLEFAWPAYRERSMLPYLSHRPNWDTVMLGRKPEPESTTTHLASALFPGAGHAILRSKDSPGLAAVLTFGPYGGFHGHFDKLSFVFFGNGRELGVDPGRASSQAYRLPVHKDWYKATLGHNTVLVDRASQQPATGKLLYFAAGENCSAVTAECAEAYPGVLHRRLLCLLPEYLLICDQLRSAEPHQFDWVYHHRAAAVTCSAVVPVTEFAENFAGAEYLNHVATGTSERNVTTVFSGDQGDMRLVLDAGLDCQVLTADGVGSSVLDRVPVVMIGRRDKQACFAAVLEPVRAGRAPLVTEVGWNERGESTSIHARGNQYEDEIVLSATGGIIVRRNGRVLIEEPR